MPSAPRPRKQLTNRCCPSYLPSVTQHERRLARRVRRSLRLFAAQRLLTRLRRQYGPLPIAMQQLLVQQLLLQL